MRKWQWGGLVLLAVCGSALAALLQRAPSQEVARESLDLLKAMAGRSSTAQTYTGSCVTAIAQALRIEDRGNSPRAAPQGGWPEAAARCRVMATTVCDVAALDPPREACARIRAYAAAR